MQEISDLMDAGIDIVKQKQIDADKKKKEDQKKNDAQEEGERYSQKGYGGIKR